MTSLGLTQTKYIFLLRLYTAKLQKLLFQNHRLSQTIIDKWAETNALARFNHPHLPPLPLPQTMLL